MKIFKFAAISCVLALAGSPIAHAASPTAPAKAPTAPAKAPNCPATAGPDFPIAGRLPCTSNLEDRAPWGPDKSCLLWHEKFVFGSTLKMMYYACNLDKLIVYEADPSVASSKLSLLRSNGSCPYTPAPAQPAQPAKKAICEVKKSYSGYYDLWLRDDHGSELLYKGEFYTSNDSQQERCMSYAAAGRCTCR